jgi:hypothetical protein
VDEFARLIIHELTSTLAGSCGVGERVSHAVPNLARNFDAVSARPGHERDLMRPYFVGARPRLHR